MSSMPLEQARKIVSHVAEQRIRWGKMYDGSDVGTHQLMDALVVMAREGGKEDQELREELTTTKRRLNAANARVAKLAKKAGVEVDNDDSERQ